MRRLLPRLALLATIVTISVQAQDMNSLGVGAGDHPATTVPKPAPKTRYFNAGDWYVAPRVWLAGVDGGAVALGASIEKAITDPQGDDDGLWSVGVDFDYYTYKYAGLVNLSVLPIGTVLNYHFALENARIDPYIGAGLGYSVVTVSGGGASVRQSGAFFQSQLGVRYFVTDATAIGAHVGTGIGNIAVSLTLRF